MREHTRSVHRLDNLLEVGAVAKESSAGAGEVDDPLEETGVDGGQGELPLLLEAREVGEKLTDTGGLLQRGEIFEHLVEVQRLWVEKGQTMSF